MKHLIEEHDDGEIAWTEFECGSCRADMDYFGADQKPLLEASSDDAEFTCLNCGHSEQIVNRTGIEDRFTAEMLVTASEGR